MPKVSKTLRDAIQELKEYRDSLAPQRGFFSTLDKLIEEAPFEDAPVDQWMNYLKPGRMYRREGLQFPLKQEELDYAIPEEIESQLRSDPSRKLNKHAFLRTLRLNRPSFGVQIGSDEFSAVARDRAAAVGRLDDFERRLQEIGDNPWTSKYYPPSPETRVRTKSPQYGPDSDSENMRLSHTSPFSTYEESATTMRGYDYGRQHFDPDTISHSRTSSHEVADVGGGRARLVEEIQSDPHQDAAERTTPPDYRGSIEDAEDEGVPLMRRGYQDPRYSTYTEEPDPENWPSNEWLHAQRYKPQDAPFKTPAEYGRLELRKQLINAAREGEDYLAITRPEDQIERYSLKGDDAEAMRHIYGKVYRGELEKLAKQYGAEVTDVSLPVKQAEDVRPQVMRDNGYETMHDLMEDMTHPEYAEMRLPMLRELIDDLSPGSPPLAEQLRRQVVDFDRVIKTGHPDTRAAAVESFGVDLQYLYDQYAAKVERTGLNSEMKSFPAIRLTPEVRERIKRAGVPLWSAAGAAGLLEMGRDLPDHEEERPGMAEGGEVDSDDMVDKGHRLLDRLGAAYRKQWSTLDNKGDARSAIYSDFDAPQDEWQWNTEAGMALPPQRAGLPGIYRDTVSIPAQFGYSGPGSDYMLDQLAELEATGAAVDSEADLPDPHGWLEHGADAAGTMLAQLPVPGGAGKRAGAGLLSKVRKIIGAPLEWLSPTIQPSLGNYAAGTLFGAAQEVLPESIQRTDARNQLAQRIAEMSYSDRRRVLRAMEPEDREIFGRVVSDVERRELRHAIENLPADKRAKFDELVDQMEDHLREASSAPQGLAKGGPIAKTLKMLINPGDVTEVQIHQKSSGIYELRYKEPSRDGTFNQIKSSAGTRDIDEAVARANRVGARLKQWKDNGLPPKLTEQDLQEFMMELAAERRAKKITGGDPELINMLKSLDKKIN